MPKMQEQVAYGSVKCRYETGEDWKGDATYCNKPKARHKEGVKGAVLDHPFGGESGRETATVFPTCGHCQKPIEKGTKYRSWKPRYGAAMYRHATCPSPPRSALTGSEILSMAWDIADDDLGIPADADKEALEEARDDLAERIGEVVSLIQEKMDAIPSQAGFIYEELDERLGMYEAWQEEVENVDFDENVDDDGLCAECDSEYGDHDDDDHDFTGEFDTAAAIEALEQVQTNAPE